MTHVEPNADAETKPVDQPADGAAPADNSNLPAPRPYMPNDTLKNRLVALTHEKFSLQSLGNASGRVLSRAMKALAIPVARRMVMPGEKNKAVAAAREQLAALPKGTRGLFRTDGSLIIAAKGKNLLQSARSGNYDLTGIYLAKRDLEDRNLAGLVAPKADFRLSRLSKTRFEAANLEGADLRRCNLNQTKFNNIDGAGAVFDESRLNYTRFNNARLSGASFKGCIIRASIFDGANLTDVDFTAASFKTHEYTEGDDWNGYTKYCSQVSMVNADLTGARFDVDTPFERFNLHGAKLDGVKIIGRDGQVIEGAKLSADGNITFTRLPGTTPALPPATPNP